MDCGLELGHTNTQEKANTQTLNLNQKTYKLPNIMAPKMQMKNWKEKTFFLLKKSRISIAELWIIYKSYTRVLNFIKYRDPYFFRSVALEISTSCNRTCYYCPNQLKGTPTAFMEESTFNEIIDQLKTITFSGIINYHFYNEPLLDNKTLKIYQAC